MCNKGIFFSISYMPMHNIFDCAQKKKKKKRKKRQKEIICVYMIASMFSRKCESYMIGDNHF